MIDLRSDTVTKPTPEMRRAMAEAEVGDDVYGEDPTVNRLQERAAEIFEKEAAIFVPTGSMGNQAAVKIHTRPGQEVIIEERGHIYNFEMATMSSFAGVLARPVKSTDGSGILTWDEIAGALHHNAAYYVAPTGLIALSGFIPTVDGWEMGDVTGLPVAIGHGTYDPVIGVQFGRSAKERLEQAGAEVTYRESATAHTVDPGYLGELRDWVRARAGTAA